LVRQLTIVLWTAVVIYGTEQPARIRVRNYNLANVPALEMAKAKDQAAHVFASAGIVLEWEDGDRNADEAREVDMSVARPNMTPSVLGTELIDTRILPQAPPTVSRGILGMALPFASRGIRVTVYANSIGDVAQRLGVSHGHLLGATLAHEIGHILLGSSTHSSNGIMRERWTADEYRSIGMGTLRFVADEARRIRATLLRCSPNRN